MNTCRTFQKYPQSPCSHSLVKSPASLSHTAYKETFLLLPLQHPYKVQRLIKGNADLREDLEETAPYPGLGHSPTLKSRGAGPPAYKDEDDLGKVGTNVSLFTDDIKPTRTWTEAGRI